jgi:superfamily I DNA/RNA helicase
MAVAPSRLPNASPCDHLIQAYTDDAFLARVVTDYIAAGLARRDAVIIIATATHIRAFTDRLAAEDIDASACGAAGQLLVLDAEDTLARFMVDGRPERTAFLSVIATALDRVRAAGHQTVRLYGEMVDLLWQEQLEATLALEALWNELLSDERLSLLCAYRIDALDRHAKGVLRQVTHCHSRLMPPDEPERFEAAVDRAYAEVFGVGGDVVALRSLMVSRHAQGPSMPPGHAALFALDDMPPFIANDIRGRVRQYYRGATRRSPLPPSP